MKTLMDDRSLWRKDWMDLWLMGWEVEVVKVVKGEDGKKKMESSMSNRRKLSGRHARGCLRPILVG